MLLEGKDMFLFSRLFIEPGTYSCLVVYLKKKKKKKPANKNLVLVLIINTKIDFIIVL